MCLANFLILILLLVSAVDAQAFAIRRASPDLETTFQQLAFSQMRALPEVEIDPACQAPTHRELFPDFRGNFDNVRRASSSPPIVMREFSVVPDVVNNQSQWPEDYLCQQSRGQGCWRTVRSRNTPVRGANLETAAIRGLCLPRLPSTVSDVFIGGAEFPATFVGLWTSDYLRYRWERSDAGGVARLRERFPQNDTITLFELNIRAADLWSRMQACYAGNAESARAAYAAASFSCVNGGNLVREVARFRQDIQNYFRSSYFRQPGLVPRNLMDVAFHISNGLPLTEPVTAFKFPSIHPLFSQVVLELQLELYSIDEEISAEQLGVRMTGNGGTGFYFAISQFFHFVDGVGAQTLGLWPAGARAAKHWHNYKLMGTISSSVPGVFVRRYIPAIQTGIDHRRLPDFYVQNAEAIAIAMREIGRRYDRINGR